MVTPTPGPGGGGHIVHTRSVIPASLHRPSELGFDFKTLATNFLLALLMIILVSLPPSLFNDTWSGHQDEIKGWFPWLRSRSEDDDIPVEHKHRRWRNPWVLAGFGVISSVIYGFLDPHFGLDRASMSLVLGLSVAFLLLTIAWELPAIWWTHRRTEQRLGLRVFPAVVPLAVVCVAFSRIAHFQPGFLIGAVAGAVALSGESNEKDEGRGVLGCALAVAVLSVVAWFAWAPISSHLSTDSHPAFFLLVADAALATIVISGLQMLIFGLLPVRFVKGDPLRRWSTATWLGLVGFASFGLMWLVVHPKAAGGLGAQATPVVKTVAPFIALAIGSIAFWAYFRVREASGASERRDVLDLPSLAETAQV